MTDSPHLATPGRKLKLKNTPSDNTGQFQDKDEAAKETEKHLERIWSLQEKLYAESKQSLLVIFQSMDCGGKDGAIRKIFSGVNPQGCQVTSFKVPSTLERSHDFLWRHHIACPPTGMIGIHNRSHYESVLVERVHEIAPKKVWSARYDRINAFEKMLVDSNTTILKFFLHISKREQKQRLEDRLADKSKHWKFNINDVSERKRWDDYADAYEDAIQHCSTQWAPWYVIPADHKWYRNYVVSQVIADTLKAMNPKYPEPQQDLSRVKID